MKERKEISYSGSVLTRDSCSSEHKGTWMPILGSHCFSECPLDSGRASTCLALLRCLCAGYLTLQTQNQILIENKSPLRSNWRNVRAKWHNVMRQRAHQCLGNFRGFHEHLEATKEGFSQNSAVCFAWFQVSNLENFKGWAFNISCTLCKLWQRSHSTHTKSMLPYRSRKNQMSVHNGKAELFLGEKPPFPLSLLSFILT